MVIDDIDLTSDKPVALPSEIAPTVNLAAQRQQLTLPAVAQQDALRAFGATGRQSGLGQFFTGFFGGRQALAQRQAANRRAMAKLAEAMTNTELLRQAGFNVPQGGVFLGSPELAFNMMKNEQEKLARQNTLPLTNEALRNTGFQSQLPRGQDFDPDLASSILQSPAARLMTDIQGRTFAGQQNLAALNEIADRANIEALQGMQTPIPDVLAGDILPFAQKQQEIQLGVPQSLVQQRRASARSSGATADVKELEASFIRDKGGKPPTLPSQQGPRELLPHERVNAIEIADTVAKAQDLTEDQKMALHERLMSVLSTKAPGEPLSANEIEDAVKIITGDVVKKSDIQRVIEESRKRRRERGRPPILENLPSRRK